MKIQLLFFYTIISINLFSQNRTVSYCEGEGIVSIIYNNEGKHLEIGQCDQGIRIGRWNTILLEDSSLHEITYYTKSGSDSVSYSYSSDSLLRYTLYTYGDSANIFEYMDDGSIGYMSLYSHKTKRGYAIGYYPNKVLSDSSIYKKNVEYIYSYHENSNLLLKMKTIKRKGIFYSKYTSFYEDGTIKEKGKYKRITTGNTKGNFSIITIYFNKDAKKTKKEFFDKKGNLIKVKDFL